MHILSSQLYLEVVMDKNNTEFKNTVNTIVDELLNSEGRDKALLAAQISDIETRRAALSECIDEFTSYPADKLTVGDLESVRMELVYNHKELEVEAAILNRIEEVNSLDKFFNTFGTYRLSVDQRNGFWFAVATRLTTRELTVVRLRIEGNKWDYIGHVIGAGGVRANQLYLRAFRKLSEKNTFNIFRYGYEAYEDAEREKSASLPERIGSGVLVDIDELSLPKAVRNTLKRNDIDYVNNLPSENELLRLPQIGKGAIAEINKALANVGLPALERRNEHSVDGPVDTWDLESGVIYFLKRGGINNVTDIKSVRQLVELPFAHICYIRSILKLLDKNNISLS